MSSFVNAFSNNIFHAAMIVFLSGMKFAPPAEQGRMIKYLKWLFKGARETQIMPTKIPTTSEERKRLLQSFSHLPSKDKLVFSKAAGHLRWLTILWDLDELAPASLPSISEKQHILLAYKHLQILWFNKMPESGSKAFTIYIRDRLPDDQSPERINETFDRSADELTDLCKEMPRPKWLKNGMAVMTSIDLFPQTSR